MQSDLCSVLPTAIGVKHPCTKNHFQLVTSCTMYVNAGHVNDYIWDTVVYMHIMWILNWTELGLYFLPKGLPLSILINVIRKHAESWLDSLIPNLI